MRKSRITKGEWESKGGLTNSKLTRRMVGKGWRYYWIG